MDTVLIRRPGAYLPLLLSAAALATVLFHIVTFGTVREADEGAAAHIFQLLMAAQIPIVAFFVVKWLPQSPASVLRILLLQVAAALAALAPVFIFKL
jgi:hypothetical protein